MASAPDSFPGVTFHFYLFFVIRVAVAGFLPDLIFNVFFLAHEICLLHDDCLRDYANFIHLIACVYFACFVFTLYLQNAILG